MSSETVKVMVRCRPMNKLEVSKGCGTCVQVDTKANQIVIQNSKESESAKAFTYDYVFPPDIMQQTVYENSAFPLVESVVEGYNGTIFAYGQTGCGKTHSMLGKPNDEVEKGIIPRTFSHIVSIVESANDKKFLIRCSYMEIYNEEIHDLLGKDVKARMELKESPDKGVFVKDLTMNIVKSVAEMEKWMNIGTENRSVGATAMNKDSSRSHSLFTVYIECSYKSEGEVEEHYTAGKLNLVDLAGSERQSKTQATGDRLKEATKINLSLSALGNVISALVDGKVQHVPYRDSKLTRLLQDSLGGNTKTIMLAAVSPADYNYEETLSTLRYASRAKNIKNQPKVNQDPKDALLKEYADEIKKLKDMLLRQQGGEQLALQMNNQPQLNQKSSHSQQQISLNQAKLQNNGSLNEKELRQLKEKNNALFAERKQMEDELKQKEKEFIEQLQEKEKIQQLLKEVEMKTMVGGTADQEKKKKLSQMRQKLKKQMQEHEKMTDEIQKKEDEFLFLENKYSSLQEELDATKKIVKKLRVKYKQSQLENADLERENEITKQDLLDTIRYQQREVKIYQSICLMLLTQDEIEIIKSQGEWIDDYQTYKLPPFYFKNKKLTFPKLPEIQSQQFIDSEKLLREIEFSINVVNNNMDSFGKQTQTNGFNLKRDDDSKQVIKYPSNNQRKASIPANRGDENNPMSSPSVPQEFRRERFPTPQTKEKKGRKSFQKFQVSERQKVPNMPLDPLEGKANTYKLANLVESNVQGGSFNSGETRKIQQQGVLLQPIIGSKQPPNSASIFNGNGRNNNNNPIDFEFISQKQPNKIKLEKMNFYQ